MFSIPPLLLIAENEMVLEVCVTIQTSPLNTELAKQVDLTLTTMSGTGKHLSIIKVTLSVNV